MRRVGSKTINRLMDRAARRGDTDSYDYYFNLNLKFIDKENKNRVIEYSKKGAIFMGIILIDTYGSFKTNQKKFRAQTHGHAHAVAEAIEFLSKEVLPEAIAQDHELQKENQYPEEGFRKEIPK